jgi:hypothetical protein
MVTKRFFFICAGILCLALAYHFGAQSATAQGGLVASSVNGGPASGLWAVVVGRTVVIRNGSGGLPPTSIPEPVPGTEAIMSVDALDLNYATVILANGDTWEYWPYDSPRRWIFAGNMLGGPTPATRETWGQMKARYRQGAGAATQDK